MAIADSGGEELSGLWNPLPSAQLSRIYGKLQPFLALAQLLLGPSASDELAYLVADKGRCSKQFLVEG